jgi:hypothetical protein
MCNHRSGRVLTVGWSEATPGRSKNHHPLIGHGPHLTRTPRPAGPPMFPKGPRTTRSTRHSGRYSGRAHGAGAARVELRPPGEEGY